MAKRKRSTRESDILHADQAKKASKSHVKAVAPQIDIRPRTRATKTIVFGKKVLDVTELLEKILVFLPLQDLFVLQRVSRTWNSTIARCPAIRKKMFLEAEEAIMPTLMTDWPRRTIPQYDARKLRLNPILVMALKESYLREPWVQEEVAFGPIVLSAEFHSSRHATSSSVDIPCEITTTSNPDWSDNKIAADASWRRMLLSQPPITSVGLQTSSNHLSHPPATLGAIYGDPTASRRLHLLYENSANDMAIIRRDCKHHFDWETGICGCLWYLKHGLE